MRLARARAIVDDVVANAAGPVSVFVADPHGELVAAATMDGAAPDTRINAQRKAYTAARSDATSTRSWPRRRAPTRSSGRASTPSSRSSSAGSRCSRTAGGSGRSASAASPARSTSSSPARRSSTRPPRATCTGRSPRFRSGRRRRGPGLPRPLRLRHHARERGLRGAGARRRRPAPLGRDGRRVACAGRLRRQADPLRCRVVPGRHRELPHRGRRRRRAVRGAGGGGRAARRIAPTAWRRRTSGAASSPRSTATATC